MARSKSPTGSKSKAVSNDNNKDQVGFNPSSSAAAVTAAAEAKPVENVASADLKAESRKLEVVKSEPRKNILPINLEDEIRRRAYELYQQRGKGTGSEADDWLNAEREIRQRYRQQSA